MAHAPVKPGSGKVALPTECLFGQTRTVRIFRKGVRQWPAKQAKKFWRHFVGLSGIIAKNFRGLSAEVEMHPFKAFNVFAGKNNAGKTNCLLAIMEALSIASGAQDRIELTIEKDGYNKQEEPRLGLILDAIEPTICNGINYWNQWRGELLAHWPATGDSYRIEFGEMNSWTPTVDFSNEIAGPYGMNWVDLVETHYSMGTQRNPQTAIAFHIERLIEDLGDLRTMYLDPYRKLVKQARKIDKEQLSAIEKSANFTGEHVASLIAKAQNPSLFEKKDLKPKFDDFLKFVRDIFECTTAMIRVPADEDDIIISLDGNLEFSVEDYGTGIRQVIIIAAACAFMPVSKIFIEEPESNLHPTLLRKLTNFLMTQTDNQYFVSTHSATLIDTPGAAIFHVSSDSGQTKVEYVSSKLQQATTCFDLGFKASDLVQANCVIWIEGPTEQILLKHWLAIEDQELKEGAHYSMMFYGGGLFVHLSGSQIDEDPILLEDMISLTRMCQNCVFIADSDRADVNDNKETEKRKKQARLVESVRANNGWAWVTAGREIENYLPTDLLRQAAINKHADSDYIAPDDQIFGQATRIKARSKLVKGVMTTPEETDFNKLKVAKEVLTLGSMPTEIPDVLDLREKIGDLAAYLRRVNGLPPKPVA